MSEQYGTNLPGLTGYEGDVTADGGETLIGSDSDGATALLFGPAALREIQAGVANGDFASAPDEPDADINDENPLPYFTAEDNSGGAITARVIEDASAGSGNVLRFRITGGTSSGNSLTIKRFVPVPGTRNRSFIFTPEVYCINATSTSNAKVVLSYQYYEIDAETATGTGDTRERTLHRLIEVRSRHAPIAQAQRHTSHRGVVSVVCPVESWHRANDRDTAAELGALRRLVAFEIQRAVHACAVRGARWRLPFDAGAD